MRILIDIGHPAHVHYFRNAIARLKEKGHQVLITTRDKEVTLELLKKYDLPYICTGKNLKGKMRKLWSLFRNNFVIFRAALKFKPDIFLSFFTPFAAQVGYLMKRPVIGFMDSEFDKVRIKLTLPFTDYVFTPLCYRENYGENHFRFNGYMETFYLHPDYFKPSEEVLEKLGVQKNETYFIVRFVAFNAGHDAGEKGMDESSKIRIIDYLLSKGKVFISSESPLPVQFRHLKFTISPHEFHSALYYASMYIGEGITTASECAHLGTPAILINTIKASYIAEQEDLGLVHQFPDAEKAFSTIILLAENKEIKSEYQKKSKALMERMMDCTGFLIWLLENFPGSINSLNKRQEFRKKDTLATSIQFEKGLLN